MATIPSPFWWFCYEEGDGSNVVAFLYGGGGVKNVMAIKSFLLFSFFLGPFGLVH